MFQTVHKCGPAFVDCINSIVKGQPTSRGSSFQDSFSFAVYHVTISNKSSARLTILDKSDVNVQLLVHCDVYALISKYCNKRATLDIFINVFIDYFCKGRIHVRDRLV
ncbi:unnamed protein product, partial [Porites evermanni]